ncbi:MAG: 3-hydroxyacyl-CoA dehydrogenase family protein [Christensenellaceae bacterium]
MTVVGANGTMGYSVSGVFASFGNCKVYMVARRKEAADEAVLKAAGTVKADSVSKRLIAKTYEDLAEIIPESDLVFESVAENIELKKEINEKIEKYAKDDLIVATGTSGLSIEELSKTYQGNIRKHYTGTHFFNPPYNLTLCEVIPTSETDMAWLAEYKEYLAKVLRRSVVQIKDEAGFLGNRIGFQLMNEALQYAEQYKAKGGMDYIDAILGQFSGRSMPPIVTADFVGLDVHKAIVDNLYNKTNDYAHETFVLPGYVQELIDQGKLGVKSGEGLYKTVKNADGSKTRQVYDIATKQFRDVKKYDLPFADNMVKNLQVGKYAEAFAGLKADKSEDAQLCLTFLLKYILYSLVTATEVAQTVNDADVCMVTGFNWAPPIGVMEALGGAQEVKGLIKEKIDKDWLAKINLDAIFDKDMKSDYDFRKFFKAKR